MVVGGNVGEEAEETREPLDVVRVFETVLLLSSDVPELLGTLTAPVAPVDEWVAEPAEGAVV